MASCCDQTISGFNEYVQTLKNDKKSKNIKMTLTKFDSTGIKQVFRDEAIKDVPQLSRENYKPGALTNLYDAIGHVIKQTESRLSQKDVVLFVIMTDGQQNASSQYDRDKIFKLIKQKQESNWTFTYLGANQDSYLEAGNLGFQMGNTANYNVNQTEKAFARMASSTMLYSSNVGKGAIRCRNFYGDDPDLGIKISNKGTQIKVKKNK